MKKVMILYSTGGMGHKKAAMSVYEVFRQKAKGALSVVSIDSLELGNALYRFIYLDLYVFLMTRARWLWGKLYYLTNDPSFYSRMREFHHNTDLRSLKGIDDILASPDIDAIVTTHFVLPSIAGALRKKPGFRAKMYVIVTDYGPHSFWLSDDIDVFFLGSEPMVELFEKRGIPREKLVVTGIPVMPDFSRERDRNELSRKYGLEPSRKTLFMLSGGFGVGPMEKMLKALKAAKTPIQVITVCGHNKKAYDRIERLKKDLGYPVVLLGFTDKVPELMYISDLMVTKAGGISVTEALSMSLPMILFASMPGQETWNEEYLVSSGAAVKARKAGDIPELVDRILLSDEAYRGMKESIGRIRRPDAAEKIVERVMRDIGA